MQLTVDDLHFTHDARGPPQVDAVSFELRAGRTLGILGGNECGKTTLSQLLLGQLRASRGAVRIDGTPAAATSAARTPWMAHVHVLLALSAVAALALGLLEPRLLASSLERGAWSPPLLLLVLEVSHWGVRRRRASGGEKGEGWAPATMRSRGVAYVSSEHDAGQRLPPSSTIEAVIAQHMPLPAKAHAARRREVLAALQAAGFQMFTDNGVPTGSPESYLVRSSPAAPLSRAPAACAALIGARHHWPRRVARLRADATTSSRDARTGRRLDVRAALRWPEAPRLRAERAGLAAAAAHLRRDAVRPRHRPAVLHASAAADHAGASALAATRPGPPLPLVRGAAQLRCAGAPVVQIEFGTTILFLSVDATSVQLMSHDAAFM